MLDALFRRGNPTNSWVRSPSLALDVDLLNPSINSVPVGSRINKFSFLGRSTSRSSTPLDFTDLGISLDYEKNGTVSGFQVVLEDQQDLFSRFNGEISLNQSTIQLSRLTKELGDPYWIDNDDDDDESIWFYEYASHEIQIERTLEGSDQRIVVTNCAVMANKENRASYGVDKPWPPF